MRWEREPRGRDQRASLPIAACRGGGKGTYKHPQGPRPSGRVVLFLPKTMGWKVLESDRTDLHVRKFTRTAAVVRMGSDRSAIKGKCESAPGWSQTEPGT